MLDAPQGSSAFDRLDVRSYVEGARSGTAPPAVATARLAWSDPARLLDRFVGLLESYWERAFAAEWERLGPRLETVARRDVRTVASGGVYAVLDGDRRQTPVDRGAGASRRAERGGHLEEPRAATTRGEGVATEPSGSGAV